VDPGQPASAPDNPDRPPSPQTRPRNRRRFVAAGVLLLALVVAVVAVRGWLASQDPGVRFIHIDPNPPGTVTATVAPSEIVGINESPEAPERTGEPPDLPLPPLPRPYTVQPGDTLIDIAREFGTTVAALQLVNDLDNANLLRTGQVLVVPPAQSSIRPADPAQTLNDLARLYEVDPAVLAACNGVAPERSNEPLGRTAVLVPLRSGSPTGNPPG
jgi:hypothetical protein